VANISKDFLNYFSTKNQNTEVSSWWEKIYQGNTKNRCYYVNIIEIARIKFATIPEQALCEQLIASLKDSLVCVYECLINLPQILQ
jgi:hypothetical protein